MSTSSVIQVGRIPPGYLIRVEGRATWLESAVVHEFAVQAFRASDCAVVMDLSHTEFIDSTFLGGLVSLHKQYGIGHPGRFTVVASAEKVRQLLAPARLHTFLDIIPSIAEPAGTVLILSAKEGDRATLARHVLECHRMLAGLGGPQAAAFSNVVDQIERELGGDARHEVPSTESRVSPVIPT